jgi:protein TonB
MRVSGSPEPRDVPYTAWIRTIPGYKGNPCDGHCDGHCSKDGGRERRDTGGESARKPRDTVFAPAIRTIPAIDGPGVPIDTRKGRAPHGTLYESTVRYVPVAAGAGKPLEMHAQARAVDLGVAFLATQRMPASLSRPKRTALSVALHAIAIGVPVFLSLWYGSSKLDLAKFERTWLVAPLPPAAASAYHPPAVVKAPAQTMARRAPAPGQVVMPLAIPQHPALIAEAPPPMPEEAPGVPVGIPGGVSEGAGDLLAALALPPPVAAPAPATVTAAEKPLAPVHVGGVIQPPHALLQLAPEYPKLARLSRVQGDVVITAIIDAHGKVVQMKVMSGPPLLFEAALETLKHWVYEPTELNGRPVPIEMNVTIHFRLS